MFRLKRAFFVLIISLSLGLVFAVPSVALAKEGFTTNASNGFLSTVNNIFINSVNWFSENVNFFVDEASRNLEKGLKNGVQTAVRYFSAGGGSSSGGNEEKPKPTIIVAVPAPIAPVQQQVVYGASPVPVIANGVKQSYESVSKIAASDRDRIRDDEKNVGIASLRLATFGIAAPATEVGTRDASPVPKPNPKLQITVGSIDQISSFVKSVEDYLAAPESVTLYEVRPHKSNSDASELGTRDDETRTRWNILEQTAANLQHAIQANSELTAGLIDQTGSFFKSVVEKTDDIKLPKISLPKVKWPKIVLPEVSLPKIQLPQIVLPKIKIPRLEIAANITHIEKSISDLFASSEDRGFADDAPESAARNNKKPEYQRAQTAALIEQIDSGIRSAGKFITNLFRSKRSVNQTVIVAKPAINQNLTSKIVQPAATVIAPITPAKQISQSSTIINQFISPGVQTTPASPAVNYQSQITQFLTDFESYKKSQQKIIAELAQVSNVGPRGSISYTITNPTFAGTAQGLDDGDIPDDITVSGYLPLSGGSINGNLAVTGSTTIATVLNVSGNLNVGGIVFDQSGQISGIGSLTANVGISSSTPGAALAVKGAGLFDGGLTANFIRATSTTATSTFDGGAILARYGGNVGIGTATPSHLLSVAGDILVGGTATSTFEGNVNLWGNLVLGQSTTYITSSDITASEGFSINSDAANKDIVLNSNGAVGFNTSTPWAFLSVDHDYADDDKPVLVVADQGTSTPSLLIDWSGRVGIGTSTLGNKLEVAGSGVVKGNFNIEATSTVSSLIATSTLSVGSSSPNGAQFAVVGKSIFGGDVTITGTVDLQGSCPACGQWITSGNDIYYTTGNVGIGTNTPSTKLEIGGGGLFKGNLAVEGNIRTSSIIATSSNSGFGTSSPWGVLSVEQIDSGDENLPAFVVADQGTSTASFTIMNATGNIGIGSSSPSQKLVLGGGTFLQTVTGGPQTIGGILSTATIAQSVYVVGKYAYVGHTTAAGNDFIIYDISRTSKPVSIGGMETGATVLSVYVAGRYAYLGLATVSGNDFLVVDISKPQTPKVVGGIDIGQAVNGVFVSGKYAYIANTNITDNDFQIIDISNPVDPRLVGGADIGENGLTVYVSGKYAYVGYSGDSGGFMIYDVSNPSIPTLAKQVGLGTATVRSIYVSGSYAYIAVSNTSSTEFMVYSVSNPGSALQLAAIDLVAAGGATGKSISVAGRYAYVGTIASTVAANSDFHIIDISDPNQPFLVSGADLISGTGAADGINSIFVSGKYAYIAADTTGTENDFQVVDISGIDSPAASIGSISVNYLSVSENLQVGRNLSISEGLNVGAGGILTDGRVFISTTGTATSTAFAVMGSGAFGTTTAYANLTLWGTTTEDKVLEVVSNASSTLFSIFNNGTVGIGTGTPGVRLEVAGFGVVKGNWNVEATSTVSSLIATSTLSVGTSTPGTNTQLSVGGNVYISGGLGVGAATTSAGDLFVKGIINIGQSGNAIAPLAANTLAFLTGGEERARITSTGDLLVGSGALPYGTAGQLRAIVDSYGSNTWAQIGGQKDNSTFSGFTLSGDPAGGITASLSTSGLVLSISSSIWSLTGGFDFARLSVSSGSGAVDTIFLGTAGTDRVTITETLETHTLDTVFNGKVNVTRINPSTTLEVMGSTTVSSGINILGSQLYIGNGITATSSIFGQYGNLGFASSVPYGQISIEADEDVVGSTTPIFVVGDQGTNTPLFVITSTGRVGIATNTPLVSNVSTDATAAIGFSVATSTYIQGGLGVGAATTSAGGLFVKGSADIYDGLIVRGKSGKDLFVQGGNVGIGTNAPNNLLALHSTSQTPSILLSATSSVYWNKLGGDGTNNEIGSGWADATYQVLYSLAGYDGRIYAGLGYSTGYAEVWEYNGSAWVQIGGDSIKSSWDGVTQDNVYVLTVYNGKLYAGLGYSAIGDAEVWEYNGSAWTKIGGDAVNSSWADTTYGSVLSLVSYNGKLYAGLGDTGTAGNAEVWEYNGSAWSKVGGDAVNSSWADTTYETVYALTSYNDKLYAGLGYSAIGDAEVWEYNGSAWTKIGGDAVNSSWADTTYENVYSLTSYNGKLYAGLGYSSGDAEVWEYNGSAWTKIGGDAVNSSWGSTYEYLLSLVTSNGKLYAGFGGDTAGEAEVWEYNGSAWSKIGGDAVNSSWADTTYEYSNKLFSYNGKLYAGLASNIGDAEVWEYNTDSSAIAKVGTYGLNLGNSLTVGRNNRVGIGTYEPEFDLDVYGNFRVGGSTIVASSSQVGIGTSTPWGLFSIEVSSQTDNRKPIFVVSDFGTATPQFIVHSSGNVGISTTVPGTLLDVAGFANVKGNLNISATSTASSFIATSTLSVGTSTPGTNTQLSVGGNAYISGGLSVGTDATTTPGHIKAGLLHSDTQLVLGGLLSCTSLQSDANGVVKCGTGGGSGTVNSGSEGYLSYYLGPGAGTTVDDTTSIFFDSNTSRIGIGTSTPFGQFSIEVDNTDQTGVGSTTPVFVIQDSGTSTPSIIVDGGYGRVGFGTSSPYGQVSIEVSGEPNNDKNENIPAFVIASRGTTTPIFVVNGSSGFSGFGTATPWGRLSVEIIDTGDETIPSFVVGDTGSSTPALAVYSSGITTIDQLQTGAMTFDTNAGAISWIDMPVTSSAVWGTIQSYSAQSDATSTLTVYAESDGKGGVFRERIGIASTTPGGTLSIHSGTSSQPTLLLYQGEDSGEAIRVQTGDNKAALLLNGLGNLGIGTTTPGARLAIEGFGVVKGNWNVEATSTASSFIATSTLSVGTTTPSKYQFAVQGDAIITGTTTVQEIRFMESDIASSTPNRNTLYADNIVKAWVTYDSTVTLYVRDSFGVSSLTDGGTGLTTVTWSQNFANTSYATFCTSNDDAVYQVVCYTNGAKEPNLGSIILQVVDVGGVARDSSMNSVMAIGHQ